jgi:hypothetical protein
MVDTMPDIKEIIYAMQKNPANVRFADLCKVCDYYFGTPRQNGTSHKIYKTPWQGDPRINIQKHKDKAKPYQVLQVLKAITKRLEHETTSK